MTTMLRLQFFGDIAPNGRFCDPALHADLSADMARAASVLGPTGLRMANWEAPLWGAGRVNTRKIPRLCTTREAAQALIPLGLNAVFLANNHAYDCCEEGFDNTLRFLQEHGIAWVGAGRTAEQAASPLILQHSGLTVGVLNYVAPDTHPSLPPEAGVHLNMYTEEHMLSDVRQLAPQVDLLVVSLHWGVDYMAHPTPVQRRAARKAIEAGATIVVGHHAHRLQGDEPWSNGHIFYGLGNFLFDDLGPDRPWPPVCRLSAVANCEVHDKTVSRAWLTHFRQIGTAVQPDDRPKRIRRHARRCNRPLRLSNSAYEVFWKWQRLRLRVISRPCWFLQRSGGLVRAAWRLMRRCRARLLARTRASEQPESNPPRITTAVAVQASAPACSLGIGRERTKSLSEYAEQSMDSSEPPFVSVIIAIRNEAAYIERCVRSVLDGDYPPDRMEVLIVDGMSDDGTREIITRLAAQDARIRILDNPERIVPCGVNRGIRAARGEVITWLGGHSEYAPDFLRQSVRALSEHPEAWCVGGPMESVSTTLVGRTIAAAMSTPIGVGAARFRLQGYEGYVDTVAFASFRRWVFDRIGLFDEELARNQDAEFSGRILANGGRIWLSQGIRSRYYARDSLSRLWRQYFQYGFWRIRVLQKLGKPESVRQLVPLAFVTALLSLAILAIVWKPGRWLFGIYCAAYAAGLLVGAVQVARRVGPLGLFLAPVALAILHLSYGFGSIKGLWTFVIRRTSPGHKESAITR